MSSLTACFVGCTLVRMAEEYNGWKRIDEIQVGDMVMAVPEDGIGEAVPKRVINTFKHEEKAVWYVGIAEHESGVGEISDHLAATEDHPFCVYGYAPKVTEYAVHNPIEFYNTPQWKPVNELRVGDVVKGGIEQDYLVVCSVKPFAKGVETKRGRRYGWLQGGMDMPYWQDEEKGTHWEIDNVDTFMPPIDGHIKERGYDLNKNIKNMIQGFKAEITPLYDYDGITNEKRAGDKYAPYTTTVYNIEVENYHTYCVGIAGLVVHDKNIIGVTDTLA